MFPQNVRLTHCIFSYVQLNTSNGKSTPRARSLLLFTDKVTTQVRLCLEIIVIYLVSSGGGNVESTNNDTYSQCHLPLSCII